MFLLAYSISLDDNACKDVPEAGVMYGNAEARNEEVRYATQGARVGDAGHTYSTDIR